MKEQILKILEECNAKGYDDLHFKEDREYVANAIVESGNIISLPCRVGTTLYFIWNKPHLRKPIIEPRILETQKWYFDIDEKGIAICVRENMPYGYNGEYFYYLGEMVFLTKAEAEAKMKVLKGE